MEGAMEDLQDMFIVHNIEEIQVTGQYGSVLQMGASHETNHKNKYKYTVLGALCTMKQINIYFYKQGIQ